MTMLKGAWIISLRNGPTYNIIHIERDVWDKVCEVISAAENRYGNNPMEDQGGNDRLDNLLAELRNMVE